jgi:tetratricopeptide (TPR) repeat protein
MFAVIVQGFSNAEIGSMIRNETLPTLGDSTHTLLGDEQANVFLFFRPDQDHSRETLKLFVELEEEFAEKSVHWVAIVSDSYPTETTSAFVRETGIRMPVLVDRGDSLYGRLGVALHPVVGITDKDHILKNYEPFTKVSFIQVVRARILFLLGEITEEESARVIQPLRVEQGGSNATARRHLKFAQILFKIKKHDQALEKDRESIALDPDLAEGHALIGSILAVNGDCEAALQAFDQALALDSEEPTALSGREACLKKTAGEDSVRSKKGP